MDKQELRERIIGELQNELAVATQAANEAMETATHEDSVAENQYDTFGLEASYLAEGQSKRVQELKEAISQYQKLALKAFDEDTPISLSAVVTLELEDGSVKRVFVGPAAGGLKLETDGQMFLIITPVSPLGKALIGKVLGDTVPNTAGNQPQDYEITAVA